MTISSVYSIRVKTHVVMLSSENTSTEQSSTQLTRTEKLSKTRIPKMKNAVRMEKRIVFKEVATQLTVMRCPKQSVIEIITSTYEKVPIHHLSSCESALCLPTTDCAPITSDVWPPIWNVFLPEHSAYLMRTTPLRGMIELFEENVYRRVSVRV